jgi:ABC-type transport system involved in multi-copper enzyme maturation permease subunit
MFKHYIRSKYILLFAKTILVMILFLFIYFFNSLELTHKKKLHPNIFIGNNEIAYAEFIDDKFLNDSDSSSSAVNDKEKSDLFYYILGIIILIAAGFILKQRYEQYLKQRDNL